MRNKKVNKDFSCMNHSPFMYDVTIALEKIIMRKYSEFLHHKCFSFLLPLLQCLNPICDYVQYLK